MVPKPPAARSARPDPSDGVVAHRVGGSKAIVPVQEKTRRCGIPLFQLRADEGMLHRRFVLHRHPAQCTMYTAVLWSSLASETKQYWF